MRISQRTYRANLRKLSKSHRNEDFDNAYEIAESLFINTSYPFFFFVCLDCLLKGIKNKDVEYLLRGSIHESLREFLRGLYFAFIERWPQATNAFRSSLSLNPFERPLKLYVMSAHKGEIKYVLEEVTISEAARENIIACEKAQKFPPKKVSVAPFGLKEIKSDIKEVSLVKREPLFSLENYDRLEIEIGKNGKVIPACKLIPAGENIPEINIEFYKRTNHQFTFLLLLVLERSAGENDWLSTVDIYEEEYIRINELCGITLEKPINQDGSKNDRWARGLMELGWCEDPTNVRRKLYMFEINDRANGLGLKDQLIVSNPRAESSGGYELAPFFTKENIRIIDL